jgi:hypothetical protein
MASWRRKVIALFPDLRHEAQRPKFNVYSAFFELLPRTHGAHHAGDAETLRRIYGFAEWCFQQKAKEVWNPAGVCFYEHVFDLKRALWPDVVPWLSPRVVEGCWGLWEWRMTAEELEYLKGLFAKRRRLLYREARLMLGLHHG